jgi:predicted metallopeptidase
MLRICSPVEQLWYAERPFPAFTVDIAESVSQQRATAISGWKISVTMVDGFGMDASDKLSGTGQSPGHLFPVSNGKASVSGIRFRGVSSKAGGGFRLVISVVFPDANLVSKAMTEKIQVLSYRLYHAPKVAFENLRPDDSVSKMRGIGSLYAKRFQSLGIERVSQLAAINVNTLGEEGIKRLLGNLRKDRGAMTLSKLNEYIQQARDIISRSPTFMQMNTHTHTVARISNDCLTPAVAQARVAVQPSYHMMAMTAPM